MIKDKMYPLGEMDPDLFVLPLEMILDQKNFNS